MNCNRCGTEIKSGCDIKNEVICPECLTTEEKHEYGKIASLLINGHAIESYLRPGTRCNICNKTFVINDRVKQQFIGIIKFAEEENELGIETEEEYTIHINCEKS